MRDTAFLSTARDAFSEHERSGAKELNLPYESKWCGLGCPFEGPMMARCG